VRAEGIVGHEELLRSVWRRYGGEVAITEVHLGSSREEQLRWLEEAWQAALVLCREGVPVRAVTAWALLGSFDWNSLFTRHSGCYEPGAFDVSGPRPRPTAIAAALKELAATGELRHHCLRDAGWWRRPERFLPQCRPAGCPASGPGETGRCLVIAGRTGRLGQAFARLCQLRGLSFRLLDRGELDIACAESVGRVLDALSPWALVNAAGLADIDEAEGDPEQCFRANTAGPVLLAQECRRRRIPLLTFSTDMVFNGCKGEPYHEEDPVAPLNVYGQSKAEAERRVLEIYPEALVVRSSAFFGPWDQANFATATLRRLGLGEPVAAACDLVVSPTYLPDLVHASLDLLLDREHGIWHLTNRGSVSWAEFALACARLAGLDPKGVMARPAATLGYLARPACVPLASVRGGPLPELEDAIRRFLAELAP